MSGITALDLQEALKAEIARLFSDRKFLTPSGEDAKVKVFLQNLPITEAADAFDENVSAIPYCVVRLNAGKQSSLTEPMIADIMLILGIYNPDKNHQGYRDIVSLVNLVYERFMKNPYIGNFEMLMPFNYSVVDKAANSPFFFGAVPYELSTYPFSFGTIEMNFRIPSIEREDIYS